MDLTSVIALLTLLCMGAGTAAGLVWKITRAEAEIRSDIESIQQQLADRQDTRTREIGESMAALRQKINDVELNAANTYLRREDHLEAQKTFLSAIREVRDEIAAGFVRLDEKIERLRGGVGPGRQPQS